MGKKNHHYVPKFYLRRFQSEPERINIYHMQSGRSIRSGSLSDQCYKRKLYGKTDDLENILAELEGNAAPVFRKLAETEFERLGLTAAEDKWIRVFLGLQITRTTAAAQKINDSIDKFAKLAFSRRAERDGIDLSKVRIGYDRPVFQSMENFLLYAVVLGDLPIHLIVNDTEFPFVTSDNPVVLYNQYCEPVHKIGRIGADCRGLQVFFPISPRKMLLLYDPKIYALADKKADETHIGLSDARTLNLLTVINADKVLLFSDWNEREEIERVVTRAADFLGQEKIIVNEFQAQDDENRSLIQVAFPTPNLNLRLSFMRIRRRAQSTPPSVRATEFRTFRDVPRNGPKVRRIFRRVETP